MVEGTTVPPTTLNRMVRSGPVTSFGVGSRIWSVALVRGRPGVDLPPQAVVVSAPDTTTAGISSRTSTVRAVIRTVLLQGLSTAVPTASPMTTVLSFSGAVQVPEWA